MTKEQFQEIHHQWIEDLRSGEFIQGGEAMKKTNEKGETTHCCLGVLLERTPVNIHQYNCYTSDVTLFISKETKEHYKEYLTFIKTIGLNSLLAAMNDGNVISFTGRAAAEDVLLDSNIQEYKINTIRSFNQIAALLERIEDSLWNYYQNYYATTRV